MQGAAPVPGAPAENIAAPETSAEAEAPAEAAVALNPRQAIAPAAAAIGARSRAAQAHPPAGTASAAAQAGAITPATEQQREADAATMANFSSAADKPAEVDRDDFRAKLKAAILSKMQTPQTEDEAKTVMHEGARNASGALQGELHGQSAKAAGPIASAADPAADVKPADMTVDAAAPLVPEQAGAPPAPVAPDSVVPPPLPAERLDYSSERGDTDRAMAENQVTSEQMQRSNEPQFSAVVQERQGVEAREAQMPGELRAGEAGVRDQAHAGAAQAIEQGLGGMHDNRTARVANVAGQQTTTRDADAAERTRITGELERIKGETRTDVEIILRDMEKDAGEMFDAGLGRAEKAYSDVFDEEKGGVGTWLTTWGDDWEELIEHSLATAKVAYDDEVSRTIDAVATYVEGKLAEAKARVQRGKAEVDQFVAGLDKSVAQFGQEASANIAADFEAMTGEIDQRRDRLVDGLVQKFSESQKRVSALEQKLREENKSLWQRIYDATVGVIKTIIAFKNMLLDVLARAAGVIGAIISDPIGFLGNLIDGVQAGLDQFVDNIETHLKEGLMGWLFGAMEGAGIQVPATFDLKGILSIVLQVLGLTYTNIRKRAVLLLGEETVSRLEQVAEIFKILVTEGPAGLWHMLMEKLGDIKDMILEQIRNWVIEEIIKAGILWLVSLLNPASAFIKACKAIYDIVMFFIERGKQILDLVNAILDTISAIVSGNIQAMADKVEGALARMIPVAISFLASLLGLGGISEKIREIIETIQKPVNAAIDWVIGKAVTLAQAAGQAVRGLAKGNKKEDHPDDPEKQAKLSAGLLALVEATTAAAKHGEIDKPHAKKIAAEVKKNHPVFKSITVIDGGDSWDYAYKASDGKVEGAHKGLDIETITRAKLRAYKELVEGEGILVVGVENAREALERKQRIVSLETDESLVVVGAAMRENIGSKKTEKNQTMTIELAGLGEFKVTYFGGTNVFVHGIGTYLEIKAQFADYVERLAKYKVTEGELLGMVNYPGRNRERRAELERATPGLNAFLARFKILREVAEIARSRTQLMNVVLSSGPGASVTDVTDAQPLSSEKAATTSARVEAVTTGSQDPLKPQSTKTPRQGKPGGTADRYKEFVDKSLAQLEQEAHENPDLTALDENGLTAYFIEKAKAYIGLAYGQR